MHRWRHLTLCLMAVTALACGKAAREKPLATQEAVLHTVDGMALSATVYPTARPNPPGLILVHMLGSDRAAWKSFASHAQAAGYLCIAFDMRGHGGSQDAGGAKTGYSDFTTQDWLAVADDIEAARQALLKEGANPKDIGIVGASIGANVALRYAADNADIPAIVLISPGLDYKGVKTEDAIVTLGQRPCLLVTTEGDSYSDSSCAALKKKASGLCELREYAGSAHGTAIFDAAPTSLDDVLLWLNPIFNAKPAN